MVEVHGAWQLDDATKRPAPPHGVPFARRGRAVTAKQRVLVRGNRSGKEVWQVFVA